MSEQRRCPGCSNESPTSLPFCASCGLLFETKRCASCKAEWQGDLAYCASCGFDPASAWANEAPPAPPVEVAPPPPPPDPSMQPSQPPSLPPNYISNLPIGNPPPPRVQYLAPWQLPAVPPGMRVCHVCAALDSTTLDLCMRCGSPLAPIPQPWRATLANDPIEHAFLVTLRTAPSDTATRMVYADWLETRGDSARASFVRRQDLPNATVPDRDWRAIVSRREIGFCDEGARCPGRWDMLDADPADEHARRCHACDKTVMYCPLRYGNMPAVIDYND